MRASDSEYSDLKLCIIGFSDGFIQFYEFDLVDFLHRVTNYEGSELAF